VATGREWHLATGWVPPGDDGATSLLYGTWSLAV